MVTTLATAFGDRKNIATFAKNNPQGNYTVVIDSSNRLKMSDQSNICGFRLHGGEEYGYFNINQVNRINLNPTDDYSDYAFSFTNPDGQSYYLQICLYELTNHKRIVDGKERNLRGFPGAYRITTVYKNPDDISTYDFCPRVGWSYSKSKPDAEGLITAVATKNEQYNYMNWTTDEVGTIYIKSITIEYTCG